MNTIGIALGPGRLRAVLPGGRCLEAGDIQDPATAIAELRKAAGLPRARVRVALVPPLVDVRRVDLPPLRDEERRRVLTRDAARHFLGVRTPQVIGTSPRMPLVAAADASLIESIERAIEAAGWSLRAIVPAHVAWARAARKTDGHVAVRLGDQVELLRISGGLLLERRPLRRTDAVPEAVELDGYAAAATHAARARGLELWSEARRASRRRRARRAAGALTAAAAFCVIAAAAIDDWGLSREVAALRAHRLAIAPQVAAAMQVRDSLEQVRALIAAVDDIERAKPSWPAALTEIADYLPRDAHLTALHARGDSLNIAGVAREAGSVLRELERMSVLAGIRADGPIRQEMTSTGAVREYFRLAAQWRP